MSCCTSNAADATARGRTDTIELEFLFLDETICKPCGRTGEALDEAIAIMEPSLAAMGVSLAVTRTHVASREDAIARELVISPTIRIDGEDIDRSHTEHACGTCGDIAGGATTVTCRAWQWKGETHASAPTGKIVEAIMAAAVKGTTHGAECCSPSSTRNEFVLPENLESFFRARLNGEQRCC